MERFVRLVAPTGALDFISKLVLILLLCGGLNHARDVLMDGAEAKSFLRNFADASFTAFPMCVVALALIGHLNRLQNTLHEQAIRDALTGLRNRRWFMERWRKPAATKAVLLLIDIDHFKSVNDTYGHPFGDRALETFARHLEEISPEGVHPARLGGEEFAVVLEGYTVAEATYFADLIAHGCQVTVPHGPQHWIASSVGGAVFQPGPSLEPAIIRADEALYIAKAAGRAQFKFLPPVQEQILAENPPAMTPATSALSV